MKSNCLKCISLLMGLDHAWVQGTRKSLGKCVKKDIQIRKNLRNCREYSPINPDNVQFYLKYQRLKAQNKLEVLDKIEEAHK